jgi:hypothetical protein
MDQLKHDTRISFIQTEKVNGFWGHPNRKMMLSKIQYSHSDFLLITNDDNYYVPRFVEFMTMAAIRRNGAVGLVYCDTIHSYMGYDILKTKMQVDYIDMGSFIVRVDVAKKTGFNGTHLQADGQFAVECGQMCRKLKLCMEYISKPLFVHN